MHSTKFVLASNIWVVVIIITVTNSLFYNDSNCRYGSMEILILLLVHLLYSFILKWVSGLRKFSTGRHLISPFSKEPVINSRSCFHPLATSHQPHCLYSHGTNWHSLKGDTRYVPTYATVCLSLQ